MSENKWTNEQLQAITESNCNLLVSAAAGSGKTAVLVERIIRKITDEKNPIDIDKLLIVTFTKAAAGEMRERIADAISKKLDKQSASKNIIRQLTLLGKASITTIHSFCLEVIRNNFENIDIDPKFRIADETECSLMKLESLDEIFEKQYEEENLNFFELLEYFGEGKDEQALKNIVLDLYNFIQSSPSPEDWLFEKAENLNILNGTDFSDTPWGKVLIETARLELESMKSITINSLELLKYALGLEKYKSVYTEDLENIKVILRHLDQSDKKWDTLFYELQNIEFKRLPRITEDADEQCQKIVRKNRDAIKEQIKKLREKIITASSEDIICDLQALYPKIKYLSDIVIELTKLYNQKKNRKSIVDFNDLEHFCLKILTKRDMGGSFKPSDVALSYQQRYEEILVDEYQDSNLVQEIIVKMISRESLEHPNVFMVGDIKQSIYRFRQAKPELFLDKYNTYSHNNINSLFKKILLYKNFRSRKTVVDSINLIFKQIMSTTVGELEYTDNEALNPGAVFAEITRTDVKIGGKTELHIINLKDEDITLSPSLSSLPDSISQDREKENKSRREEAENIEDSDLDTSETDDEEILDNIQYEAKLAALKILELTSTNEKNKPFYVFDRVQKDYRKIEYRDIVILLRTTRNWADVFANELSSAGIPAFSDSGTGFFKTIEIQVVLSLLQIIDNPLQDIPLLSVLRSPIFLFTAEDLAEIRLADRNSLLFDALKKLAKSNSGSTAQKAAAFLNTLSKWREMSIRMPVNQLLWKLYDETGYYAMVGSMTAGEQRQANLRILFERAGKFEETSYKGLFNFINFVEKLKDSKGDMGSAKILGENDNVVRIMSIHKSKGLEFPVVILSGCSKKFNFQDINKSILLHQDLGFGSEIVDPVRRLSWTSAAKQAIREKIKIETISEEMRILYVAMTRAKEKLIITGSTKDIGKSLTKWKRFTDHKEIKLPVYEMIKSTNYMDWIGAALIRDNCFDTPSSLWKIKIWNKSDIQNNTLLKNPEENDFEKVSTTSECYDKPLNFSEEISRRLNWSYKFSGITKIPAKISVTELKRRFNDEEEINSLQSSFYTLIKKPLFMQEKIGLSNSEKGTVLHFVMQHIDYNKPDIASQIKDMVEKDLLTEEEAKSVDVGRIREFLNSTLGKRMLSSQSINREIPFNLEIPCYEVYKNMENACKHETILLQGIIDCYFEEADGLVLIDYKTDYIKSNIEETLLKRYKSQLNYYAKALEQLTGKKVKESYIYLFSSKLIFLVS